MRKLMWFTIGFTAACAVSVYLLTGFWLLIIGLFCLVAGIAVWFLKGEKGRITAVVLLGCVAAFGGMCAAKSYMEDTLNSIYIGSSADFSAIRVGAFSEDGMTIGVEVIAAALGLTAMVFLLIAAAQSAISARKKVRECLFD